jgi:anti-sigma factor RsiW
MSEKFDTAAAGGCRRGGDLVAYLYGEADEREAGLFRRHLEACAVCREELAAFGGVREGLGAWRAEVLGAVPSLNIAEALAPAAPAVRAAPRKRSARAALAEFFSLSPLWLRAGAFAAALAFCALFVLTLARGERVVKEYVEVPVSSGYTEEQVNALVARKVEEARARAVAETEARLKQQPREQVVNVVERKSADAPVQRRRRAARAGSRRDEQLAEDDLPRLSDLLSGSY